MSHLPNKINKERRIARDNAAMEALARLYGVAQERKPKPVTDPRCHCGARSEDTRTGSLYEVPGKDGPEYYCDKHLPP